MCDLLAVTNRPADGGQGEICVAATTPTPTQTQIDNCAGLTLTGTDYSGRDYATCTGTQTTDSDSGKY